MYILQKQLENLSRLAVPGKVVVIYGARQTGKTTLLNEFLKKRRKGDRRNLPQIDGHIKMGTMYSKGVSNEPSPLCQCK